MAMNTVLRISMRMSGNWKKNFTLMQQKPHYHWQIYRASDKLQQRAILKFPLQRDLHPQAFLEICSSTKRKEEIHQFKII